MRRFFILALLAVSITALSLEVRFKDSIVIEPQQSQLFLSDFVEDANAFNATGQGEIIFGYSPLPGKTMKIDVEYVLSKFKRYLDDTDFVLPEREIITVYRMATVAETATATDSRQLSTSPENSEFGAYNREAIEGMLRSALEERFSVQFDENLIIDYVDFEQDFFEGTFEQINLYGQSRNRFMAKVDYFDASSQLKFLRIVFDCSWITDIAICTQDIKRSVLVSDEAVRFEQLEYFDYDKPVLFANFPDDQVTKYVIKKNDIIRWTMLEKRPYVLKGQIVTAVFNTGTVVVTSQVMISSNAELGQLVRAENIDSGLTVTGVVETGPVLRIGY